MLHRGARALRRNCPRIFGPAGVRVELDARRDGRRVVADAAVHPDREADVGEGDQGRSKHFYFSCRFSTSQKDRAAQHLQGNENYIFKVVAIAQSKTMITAQLIYSLTRLDLTKQESLLLSVCRKALESNLVKLETIHSGFESQEQHLL